MRQTDDARQRDDLAVVLAQLVERFAHTPRRLAGDRVLARRQQVLRDAEVELRRRRLLLAAHVAAGAAVEAVLVADLVQRRREQPRAEALLAAEVEAPALGEQVAAHRLHDVHARLPRAQVAAEARVHVCVQLRQVAREQRVEGRTVARRCAFVELGVVVHGSGRG